MAKKSKGKSKSKSKSKAKPSGAKRAKGTRRSSPKAKPAGRSRSAGATKPARGGYAPLTVSPSFTANDAAASLAWYCDVLGFTRKDTWESGGEFQGGSVRFGDVEINISQDDWKQGRDRKKGQGVRLYITTGPDIDAFAAAVKARGGTLDHDVQDGWGVRSFSISDPDGYKLSFMRPLA
jgi:uncharacterized glyoxalase superfamily protein PhnB